MCAHNAVFGRKHETYYVEGIVRGFMCEHPMLHAWNTTSDRPQRALDWTFYPGAHWVRYYGVSISESEYSSIIAASFPNHKERNVTTLFTTRDFECVRPHLEKVLADRL